MEKQVQLGFLPLIFTQDPSGNFYLIDKTTLEVVLTDQEGKEIKRTSGSGFGSSELIDPADILWKGMNLYILDRGAKSVKLFDRLLNFRGEQKLENIFTSAQIADPVSLTVNSFGEIFITDRLSHTILAADQSFMERGDVYFIENIPGKKLSYPVKIISDGDHIAVRDSSGIFLFDRFLNYIRFIELAQSESLAGIAEDFLFLIEKRTVIIRKISQPAGVPMIYQLPELESMRPQSPILFKNGLMFIAGNLLMTINPDTLFNER